MLCSFCNSWFHLVRYCPERTRNNTHYGTTDDNDAPDDDQPSEDVPDFANMDRSIDEYNFAPVDEDDAGREAAKANDVDYSYLSLAHHIDHEYLHAHDCSMHRSRPIIKPNPNDLYHLHPTLTYDDTVPYHGVCFDEGAPHSVTGINQWMAYLRTYHIPPALREIDKKKIKITFGGKGKNQVKVEAIGTVVIRMPLPAESFFEFKSLLISNDVPMLLGLSTQRKLRAITDKDPENSSVFFKAIGVRLPLVLKFGHLYYEGPPGDYLFSTAELAQVHRNLGHATAGSVYSALRRAYPIETGASDLDKLKMITKQCKGCQMFSKQPNRYRAPLPDQCVFNYDVAVDVFFILSQPILHVVCRQTHFSRAAPLPRQDSYTLWMTFMKLWVIPYLGAPYNLWVDQAKSFLSVQFKTLANSLGCNLVPIAVEAHWSLIAERYHDPIRRITRKLVLDHPAAPLDLIVDYANLAMSHTIGPEGFTPAILAFGAQPRLPIGDYDQQPQTVINRMDLMTTARR